MKYSHTLAMIAAVLLMPTLAAAAPSSVFQWFGVGYGPGYHANRRGIVRRPVQQPAYYYPAGPVQQRPAAEPVTTPMPQPEATGRSVPPQKSPARVTRQPIRRLPPVH